MRIFVSHANSPAAELLVARLRAAGQAVETSPRSPTPSDDADPRWEDWYARGLPTALARCDAAVVVLSPAWDSSTWMGIEADASRVRAQRDPRFRRFVWDPEGVFRHRAPALGMQDYVTEAAPLPAGIEAALQRLVPDGAS